MKAKKKMSDKMRLVLRCLPSPPIAMTNVLLAGWPATGRHELADPRFSLARSARKQQQSDYTCQLQHRTVKNTLGPRKRRGSVYVNEGPTAGTRNRSPLRLNSPTNKVKATVNIRPER